jgi:two-component system cell cycle response regulator
MDNLLMERVDCEPDFEADVRTASAPARAAAREGPAVVQKLRVLAVEDVASQRMLLAKMLSMSGFEVTQACDGNEALRMIAAANPQIIITDWVMPNMDGIELCRRVRAAPGGESLYIVILTAHGDEQSVVQAFEAGADEFLNKPIVPRELNARLRAARRVIELQAALRRKSEILQGANEKLAHMNQQLFNAAHTDALTGLPNRRYILGRLKQEWATRQRRQTPLSVIMLDLDHFKLINDTYGHDVGDIVLQRMGQILPAHVRTEDTVGRVGGEEFIVVCPYTDRAEVALVAERIRMRIERDCHDESMAGWRMTGSIGVATADAHMLNWEDLVKAADQAMYQAKSGGRNCIFSTEGRLAAGAQR